MIQLRGRFKVFAAGVLIAASVAACGSSSKPTKSVVQRKFKSSQKGETHWYTTVSGQAGLPSGRWRFDLEAPSKQAFIVTPANRPYGTGQLTGGAHIKFGVLTLCHNVGKATPGTYIYKTSATQLTFTKLSDSCTARATLLTSHPWTKQ